MLHLIHNIAYTCASFRKFRAWLSSATSFLSSSSNFSLCMHIICLIFGTCSFHHTVNGIRTNESSMCKTKTIYSSSEQVVKTIRLLWMNTRQRLWSLNDEFALTKGAGKSYSVLPLIFRYSSILREPYSLVAWMWTLLLDFSFGVPDMIPVSEQRFRPPGRVPKTSWKL